MLIVSIMLLLAAAASAVWHIEQRRDDERQLLFVGREFRKAIEQYRLRGGSTPQAYPRSLQALVRDTRALVVQRYARRFYSDPMTHDYKWGVLLAPDGGIVGVYSLGKGRPIKMDGFLPEENFKNASSYREWRFVLKEFEKQGLRHGIAMSATSSIVADPEFHDDVITPSNKAQAAAPSRPEEMSRAARH
jgi:hypothetical protein